MDIKPKFKLGARVIAKQHEYGTKKGIVSSIDFHADMSVPDGKISYTLNNDPMAVYGEGALTADTENAGSNPPATQPK